MCNYGLKIQGKEIKAGDKIRITEIDGISNLSNLFRKGIIDEAILEFTKHEKYNTLMFFAYLNKEGKSITHAERFEWSKLEIEDWPEKGNSIYFCDECEMNISFADELEKSNAEFL